MVECVELKIKDGIAGIFLNRPEKSNALSFAMLEELHARLQELQRQPALRVVVLAGHGKSFCGGADIHDLAALNESTAAGFVGKIHACCDAIRKLPQPVLARLHGAVIGAWVWLCPPLRL